MQLADLSEFLFALGLPIEPAMPSDLYIPKLLTNLGYGTALSHCNEPSRLANSWC